MSCDYPDMKRLLRERACVGPWTSSTMHYNIHNVSLPDRIDNKIVTADKPGKMWQAEVKTPKEIT